MSSNLTVVQEFKKLKFQQAQHSSYHPLGDPKGHEFFYKLDPDNKKDEARSADKVKELNELVAEGVRGGRPADRKWDQELRLAATEGAQLRITPTELQVAARLNHLFEILRAAREVLLREARDYATTVLATATTSERYTRMELHARARESAIPYRFKGNV